VALHDVSPDAMPRANLWFHLHSICGAAFFVWHQRHLPPTVWQSLVGFGVLNVCKAWRWSRIQNLQRVGKNSGPT